LESIVSSFIVDSEALYYRWIDATWVIELGRKVKTSIALDGDILAWVDEMIGRKRFASRTHAIEYALQRLREQQKEELHVMCADEILS
jgi:hypothetical protein